MFYFGSHYYPAGLSIGDSSLKLAQLKKTRGKIRIQALEQMDLPGGLVVEGEIKDMDKFISYLKDLGRSPLYGQLRTDKVVASLPDTKTFVKRLKISKSLNDPQETVETEMEKHIPFLLDNIYYDWQTIKEEKDSYSVLVGACPQKISDDYYYALTRAGFSVEALESEAVALCRSLLAEENPADKKKANSSYLLIDLGRDKTTFVVYADRTVIFTTDIEESQEDIVEEISKQLKVSRTKAESIKYMHQKGEKSQSNLKIDKIVNNVFWEVNKKINEIFGYYNNQVSPDQSIGFVILSGEGSQYHDIESLISSSNVEIKQADPLFNLSEDKERIERELKKKGENKSSRGCYPDFATSIGLSLNNIF
jgi:type IV pilus assembly protein PilM